MRSALAFITAIVLACGAFGQGKKALVGNDIRSAGKIKITSSARTVKPGPTQPTALVLYDTTGEWGWAGDLYGQQLSNLLTHFNCAVTRKPIEQYKAGDIATFGSTFYIGLTYDNPLPSAFKTEVMASTKPVCWMGFNLWQIAWTGGVYQAHDPNFVNKTGFQFLGLDDSGYPSVRYKGQLLVKEQTSITEGRLQVVDTNKAAAVATSERSIIDAIPYITRGGGSFWYVADNPMVDISLKTMQDRVLAFCDAMHDMLGINHTASHRGILRIEDVSPIVPGSTLTAIADTLASEGVPFSISLIPEYKDPLGYDNGGVPEDIPITQAPRDFISALKYCQRKGGVITMHGVTHQYSNVANPYNGVSATDFEFFRVGADSIGRIVPIGVLPEDNATWVKSRITYGLNLLSSAGFAPDGWVTPHYMASDVDYAEFASRFTYSLCRSLTYTQASNGTVFYLTQFSPFTFRDNYGTRRIPETVGYIDLEGFADQAPTYPVDLQARAHANLVVRDGWAGAYFHWFYGTDVLRDLVVRLKNEGYTFVKPASTLVQ